MFQKIKKNVADTNFDLQFDIVLVQDRFIPIWKICFQILLIELLLFLHVIFHKKQW